jgi:hypothetical protein
MSDAPLVLAPSQSSAGALFSDRSEAKKLDGLSALPNRDGQVAYLVEMTVAGNHS